MQDQAKISKALEALFRTYPGFKADDLLSMAKTYLHAVSIYETQDVIAGISDFITASVPGHNPSFAPSAPMVASAVRRAMERRLNSERLNKLSLPPPADDWVDDPPEVKALSRAKLDAIVESLANTMRTDDAEADRKAKALANRTNARFDPSMDPADMASRLGLKRARYTVGDPDAENGDMGQIGAVA